MDNQNPDIIITLTESEAIAALESSLIELSEDYHELKLNFLKTRADLDSERVQQKTLIRRKSI